jgi:hypothetical protein
MHIFVDSFLDVHFSGLKLIRFRTFLTQYFQFVLNCYMPTPLALTLSCCCSTPASAEIQKTLHMIARFTR